MPKVHYIAADGTATVQEVPMGENVMRGAVYNDIAGIVGECGGAMSCATCHCYVDDAWVGKVGGPVNKDEEDLLEGVTSERKPTSRLSCQIVMTQELDGLIIHMPESQY